MIPLLQLPSWRTDTEPGDGRTEAKRNARVAAQFSSQLLAAWTHVPFYQRHWRDAAVVAAARDPREAANLRPVTKQDLLDSPPQDLLDRRFTRRDVAIEPTSGSTGHAFEMPIDRGCHRRRRVRFLTALAACGYRPGNSLLVVSSQPTALIRGRRSIMPRFGWHYVDVEQPESELMAAFRTVRPDVVYGPLSALLQLGVMLDHPPASHHRPRHVIATAEQMLPQHRQRLTATLAPNIADFYGMTELGLVAWRPDGISPFRVDRNEFHLEFLPTEDAPALEKLVVTTLRPSVLPLVRYETGDLVRRDHGAPGKPIVEFVGRSVDMLRLPFGRPVSPYRVIAALESIPWVQEFRVTQQADGSVDVVIRSNRKDVDLAMPRVETVMAAICEGCEVRVTSQQDPLPLVNGKLRVVRSFAEPLP